MQFKSGSTKISNTAHKSALAIDQKSIDTMRLPWSTSGSMARRYAYRTAFQCTSRCRTQLLQSAQNAEHWFANRPPLRLPSGNPSPQLDATGSQ